MSQVSQPDSPPGEVVPMQGKQKVFEEIKPSDCPFYPFTTSVKFNDFMVKFQSDCRSCTARKKVLMKFISEAGISQMRNLQFTWDAHGVTEQGGATGIYWSADSGDLKSRTIETFFLEKERSSEVISNHFNPSQDIHGLATRRPLHSDASTDTRFQFAVSCVRTCIKEHADCEGNSTMSLPTRVLFVGTTDSPVLYLYESAGESSQYVCLSYCWGEPQKTSPMLQTTTKTIGRFKTQIIWSQLPKTFRDAIDVTRRLEIKYIWIDSLCIIQDDKEDKAREIGQMARVYSNALLTIAATSAPSPAEGLFSRATGLHTAEKLPKSAWNPDWSEYGPLYTRLYMPHVWKDSSKYPLLTRGWAFQERLLSRRVLHFTTEELAWECMSASGCECGIPVKRETAKKDSIPPTKTADVAIMYKAWAKIVKAYSAQRLTYDADILPGLSGIANVFNTVYPDQYLCGLWKSSLLQGLCWRRRSPTRKCPTYLAPSWSWASSPLNDNNCVFMETTAFFHGLAHVSDVCCVPTYAADPMGMVSSGSLRLSAKATPGKLSQNFVTFEGRRQMVSLDLALPGAKRDVYIVAIGINNGRSRKTRSLHLLVLTSSGDHPETFLRLCHFISSGYRGWTDEEWEWWTSRGGDGWTEFTIV